MVTVKIDKDGALINVEGEMETKDSISIVFHDEHPGVVKVLYGGVKKENGVVSIKYNENGDLIGIFPGPAAAKAIVQIGDLVIKEK